MALYRYLKPADDNLPSPTGHLSSSMSPATIKAANEAVRESALTPSFKSRGTYVKYTPAQQAIIGVRFGGEPGARAPPIFHEPKFHHVHSTCPRCHQYGTYAVEMGPPVKKLKQSTLLGAFSQPTPTDDSGKSNSTQFRNSRSSCTESEPTGSVSTESK